ncbi:MAG: hypothetical protein JW704_11030 [Anaerolineaceae bacterium]|nr:hypothetical protein [Anaerolineaceae bacterium]MBN2678359.1 hypothetical protein [Anaerolineaceae bacterium]
MIQQAQPNVTNPSLVDLISDAKAHEVRLILWPCRWQLCHVNINLDWQVFDFNNSTINSIPTDPGVYAFVIQPRLANNLDASYLMYIGNTDRPLRKRYQEYLRETLDPSGRPRVIDTLIRYSGYIYFTCAPIVNQPITPAEVEEELLKAFLPPTNADLPAEVRRVRLAF